MPGREFYQTVMGRRFFEGQVPKLTRAIERLANAIEKRNEIDRQKEAEESR